MEWVGFIALALIICYCGYPKRVQNLENKIKKLEKKEKGVTKMSKIISDLIGKECEIQGDSLLFDETTSIKCTVLEVDDEWIKISYTDKKNNNKIKIIRIESVENVEIY